ncbi:glycosyltransferase [Ferrimonas sp. YFM]|uniref:glycosyltransferase n=1 Tax=Ferrimonas sp. YFM TaxID=3028878 RepID=UPI002573B0E2|nr:glycosyltransferase [Ferrimonas sp. YFM]BDY04924.1 glycosyl transferase [Ferrimonas sp. YFM]
MKPKMLIFGEDWGRHPSSSQHLALAILDEVEITWVNSIGLRQPGWRDLGRLLSKGVAIGASKGQKAPFTVVAPKLWPMASQPWVRSLNRAMLRSQLAEHGPFDYVWCALPSAVEYLDLFPQSQVIYYCGDDFNALSGVDHQKVAPLELRLLEKAHLVCCASESLRQKLGLETSHLLPHGVDLTQFSRPQERPADLPPGPVLGFYGALAPWLDYDLLAQLADLMPECNLVLIGPNLACPTTLLQRSNVHWLGPRPHASLAAYAQHFDVALLPFRDCPQIQACNPLKMREYLAAGCSVVSTRFEAAQDQAGVDVTEDTEQFLAQVLLRLLSPASRVEQRMSVVGQGWQERGNELLRLLQFASA